MATQPESLHHNAVFVAHANLPQRAWGIQGRRSFDGGRRRAARRAIRGPCALLPAIPVRTC